MSVWVPDCWLSSIGRGFQTDNYLAREPDFGKVVLSDFVRSLSVVCPGLYGKSTGWIFMVLAWYYSTTFNPFLACSEAFLSFKKKTLKIISLRTTPYTTWLVSIVHVVRARSDNLVTWYWWISVYCLLLWCCWACDSTKKISDPFLGFHGIRYNTEHTHVKLDFTKHCYYKMVIST